MQSLNIQYSLLFFLQNVVGSSIISGYATVYLLDYGVSEGWIGMILAASNLLNVLLQPLISDMVDKSKRLGLREMLILVTVPLIAITLILLSPVSHPLIVALLFLAVHFLTVMLNPLLISLGMLFTNAGAQINFGVGRGIGSLGFALGSLLVSSLVASYGSQAIIFVAMLSSLLILLVITRLPYHQLQPFEQAEPVLEETHEVVADSGNFFKKYPNFIYIVLASVLVMVFHNMFSAYFINIIQAVGGNESQLGLALAIAALAEVPTMLNYSKLEARYSNARLLMISGIGFTLKAVTIYLAASVTQIYLNQLIQMFAYGLFAVASVYYANDLVDPEDTVKAQTYLTSGQTLGGMLGSVIGGWLIEVWSLDVMLVVFIVLTVAGLFLFWRGLSWQLFKRDQPGEIE